MNQPAKKSCHLLWAWQLLLLALLLAFGYNHTKMQIKIETMQMQMENVQNRPQARPILTPMMAQQIPQNPSNKKALIALSLYNLTEESKAHRNLANLHLDALIQWLTPGKEDLPKTYQALLDLQATHPSIPWQDICHELKALLPDANPAATPTYPWHTWQHWITVQPRQIANQSSSLQHLKLAIKMHDQKRSRALLKTLPEGTEAFVKKWQPILAPQKPWDIKPILLTLAN